MLGRHQPDKGHRARGRAEATRVAEFRGDGQRREIVDAAETPQSLDSGPQRLEVEQGPEVRFDVAQSGDGFVDRAQVGGMRLIERRDRPGLSPEPRVMAGGPGRLRPREPSAVAQQEFGQPVTRAQEVRANVFATAEQIAGRLFLLGGNVNRGEGLGAVQHRELRGIAAIGLDPIAGAARDEGGGDEVAGHPVGAECPLELKAAGARFVAAGDRPLASQALDEAQNRRVYRTSASGAPASDGLAAGPRRPSSPHADRKQ